MIARHLDLIQDHFGEKYALVQTQKHLAWYTEGLGHATDCRRRLFECKSIEAAWSVFREYWDQHWERVAAGLPAALIELAPAGPLLS